MDGDIGEVIRVSADLSIGCIPEDSFDEGHRMVNLDLAGGCLLDLGICECYLTRRFSLTCTNPHRTLLHGSSKHNTTPYPRTNASLPKSSVQP